MKEIELWCGCSVDDAFEQLSKEKIPSFGMFNGKKLTTKMSLDECYISVTGFTKAEKEKKEAEYRESCLKKEKEFKKRIPKLTKEYCEKAIGIIKDSELEYWNEIVPIRLNDMYNGMELDCTIKIAEILNRGDFEKAYEELKNQGHSGMSHGLVCQMISVFCENGIGFLGYLKEQK